MRRPKLVISIVAIGLLSFLGIVIETSLNIVFPMLMREFSLSASTVQWLTTGYMLVATILIPFGSFLRAHSTFFAWGLLAFLLEQAVQVWQRDFQ